jgi:hypothetical protein
MLVQDSLGYYHEIPEAPAMVDGLGNPLGFPPLLAAIPAIAGAVGGALPAIAGGAIPAIGGLLSRILPGGGPAAAPRPPLPLPFPLPFPVPRPAPPVPAGWMSRPVPYTGHQGYRRYMRCVMWPGPAGLIPAHAPGLPQPTVPAVPVVPAALPPGAFPRRRGRRRR